MSYTVLDLEDQILDDVGNWGVAHRVLENSYDEDPSFSVPLGKIRLNTTASKLLRSDYNSYGEYDQDSTEEMYMILEVDSNGSLRYFKKIGTADSYGNITWDGKFREVTPREKIVTVYEFEESR